MSELTKIFLPESQARDNPHYTDRRLTRLRCILHRGFFASILDQSSVHMFAEACAHPSSRKEAMGHI